MQTALNLVVPAVESTIESVSSAVEYRRETEGELYVTTSIESTDEAAYYTYMLVTGQREELVNELIEEEAPEQTEDIYICGREAETTYFKPDVDVVYLAALRAAHDSFADDVVDQLLRWIDDGADADDIDDFSYTCRRVVELLTRSDIPDGAESIDAQTQLADTPFEPKE